MRRRGRRGEGDSWSPVGEVSLAAGDGAGPPGHGLVPCLPLSPARSSRVPALLAASRPSLFSSPPALREVVRAARACGRSSRESRLGGGLEAARARRRRRPRERGRVSDDPLRFPVVVVVAAARPSPPPPETPVPRGRSGRASLRVRAPGTRAPAGDPRDAAVSSAVARLCPGGRPRRPAPRRLAAPPPLPPSSSSAVAAGAFPARSSCGRPSRPRSLSPVVLSLPPSETRPQIRRGDPLNLSILVSGGKETNQDSLSNGE